MRNALVIFFILCSTLLSAQKDTIKLDFDQVSIIEVIQSIEEQSNWLFSYSIEYLKNETITIRLESDSIEQILDIILSENDLNYEILDGNLIVIRKTEKEMFNLCGNIRDAISNEVLPFANVIILNSNKGVSSNEQGYFELKNVPLDARISISYIGYETSIIKPNEENSDCLDISMELLHYDEDFLIIKDYIIDGIDLVDNGAATALRPKNIGSLPGAAEPDVLAIAQFLPGISSPSSRSSDIRIRGCTPDQNLIIWENIPIYHSAHYFGMISAINPFIIDEMNIYRGGFGAEYGGRIGGVMDLKSANENQNQEYIGIGTNMTHSYIYGHQLLSKKIPTSIDFSLRRSFDEILRTPTFDRIARYNEQGLLLGNKEVTSLPDHIQVEDDIRFGDANIKLAAQITNKDRFEISALFAANQFVDKISDNKVMEIQGDTLSISNIGISTTFEHKWSESINSSLIATYTDYKYDYRYGFGEIITEENDIFGLKSNSIIDRQINFSTKKTNALKQQWEIGYQFNNYKVDFNVLEQLRANPTVEDNASNSSLLHTVYLSWKNPIKNIIGINGGMRASYFGTTNKFYFEPRLRLSYALVDGISLHANYGRHYQFISQVQEFRGNNYGISASLWALSEESKIPVQAADLYQVGSIIKQGSWIFDIQIYARNIYDISSRAHNIELVDRGKPIIGSAKIRGFDLLVKKRYKYLKSWLSYSLSKTDFYFPDLNQSRFLSDFDQTHVLQWSNKINIKSFELGIGLQYASGLPYSIITDFSSSGNPDNPIIEVNYDGINTNRLKPLVEINLSTSYSFILSKKTKGFISFSLLNLLNQNNIESREYFIETPKNNVANIRILDKRNLPITPNLSLRMEF